MKEKFIDHKFSEDSFWTIALINEILDDYEAEGYDLSLRQLYYQLVARGYIENTDASYKRLVGLVGNGRKAGLIDWEMIADRTRETLWAPHWRDPQEAIRQVTSAFRIDKWAPQDHHVEVVVEKDALSGVLGPVCRELDVRFTAVKGYPSLSLTYEMGKRIEAKCLADKIPVVLHLGDHDPSGVDMTRDLEKRLELFSGFDVEVIRIALRMTQIRQLNPPPNPAKLSDSRAREYIRKYGRSSWELDAIEPRSLAELVRRSVEAVRDEEQWRTMVAKEAKMKAEMERFRREYWPSKEN